MLRSLDAGISGLQQFQGQMAVIGNNIANVNTTAFKSSRVQFSDTFSQTLRASSAPGANTAGTTSMQIGTGVGTASIQSQFTQGTTTRTGLSTDLAISGSGFFVVRDSLNGATYATRAGDFNIDSNGYLVTNSGMRLQGFSDAGLTTRGDLRVDATGAPDGTAPGATVESFTIDQQGQIRVKLSDNTEFTRGQVLLQTFQSPQALSKEGENLYASFAAAGPLPNPSAPGSAGVGTIQSGALELSNVDLAQEFSTMITTQRAFQACSRIVTTSDEILQELVNLKR